MNARANASTGQIDWTPKYLKETCPVDPQSPYASTKAINEVMLRDYVNAAKYNFKYVVLRYFNAAGADPKGRTGYVQDPATHIVPAMVRKVQQNQMLDIYGQDYPTEDGTCVRDYTHVKDLANAHVLALEYLLNGGDNNIINLGAGKGTSLLELIAAFEGEMGQKVHWQFREKRAGDPPCLIADITKAKEVLNWEPTKTLGDIVRDAWNWETRRGGRT
jgi:UDP-glucose 4-epimerase